MALSLMRESIKSQPLTDPSLVRSPRLSKPADREKLVRFARPLRFTGMRNPDLAVMKGTFIMDAAIVEADLLLFLAPQNYRVNDKDLNAAIGGLLFDNITPVADDLPLLIGRQAVRYD